MSHELSAVTLSTHRLVLRAIRLEDADAFHPVYSDAETMRYWSDKPTKNLEQTRETVRADVEALAQGRGLFWSVCLDGVVIGKCVLWQFCMRNLRAEIGYVLRREFWGKGLMHEALGEVIRHAFEDLGLHRIEADTDPANQGSLKLLGRLGFENEGLFRQRWNVYGEWQDSVMLGLLKPDWQQLRDQRLSS